MASFRHSLSLSLLPLFFASATDRAILDTSGFWRLYITLRTPLVRDGEALNPVGAPCDTPAPPADWAALDFDDSGWVRHAGAPFASWSNWDPGARANVGFIYCQQTSLATAQICLRGKFRVDDPAKAQGLKLAIRYRGGAAVYINGHELARGHLPKKGALSPDTPAEMYPHEACFLEDGTLPLGYGRKGSKSERLQLRLRDLDVAIPPADLRKGTNVLAIALFRSPLPKDAYDKMKGLRENLFFAAWDTCGLFSARLSAPEAAAGQPLSNCASGSAARSKLATVARASAALADPIIADIPRAREPAAQAENNSAM